MQNIRDKTKLCVFSFFLSVSQTVVIFIECNSFRGLNVVSNDLNKNRVEATGVTNCRFCTGLSWVRVSTILKKYVT
jgi:hypothetical protein